MKFKSKTEAYSYAVFLLTKIRAELALTESIPAINQGINKIKISIENHEKNPGFIANILQEVLDNSKLSDCDKLSITSLQNDLKINNYQQKIHKKYQNPLARRLESELAISLLNNPTKAMLETVKRVSDELLKLIDDLGETLNPHLNEFVEAENLIALGSFKKTPTINDIKQILNENDPAKFIEIMHIHFKFAQNVTRDVPIKQAPERQPVGKLAEIVKHLWKEEPEKFFSKGISLKGWGGDKYRSYIADELMYKSELFTANEGQRGRIGLFDQTRTRHLGLMLREQKAHEVNLPKHHSFWVADCKSQPADFKSPYVLDLLENDAVYVSGPSGMTSMLKSLR